MEIDSQRYLFSQDWRRGALGLGSPASGDKSAMGNGMKRNLVDMLKGVACVAQLCPVLCYSTDCSPPGSSIHGIFQATILEWVAIPFSRGSSRPRYPPWIFCIAGGLFTILNI